MDELTPQIWPFNYGREFQRRAAMIMNARRDSTTQSYLMAYYKTHPAQWIEDWCITYNPRNAPPVPKTMPFLLFARQREFVDFIIGCLKDRESGLVEKCRDIGATWICCGLSVWLWLFVEGSAVGWGSRKEILVDRLGIPDSIFEKIRMIVRELPKWMIPKGFTFYNHSLYMRLINPVTGSTISGEAGDNIGRGGRSMIYFKDESAHYEHPEMIEAALGDNTDVQIDISSVNGASNVFFRRRFSKLSELWTPEHTPAKGKLRVFVFDWRDHPGKSQEWYDLRKAKYDSEGLGHIFAQEVDRDYTSSVQGIIIPPKLVRAAIDAHKKLGFGEDGERTAALDVADEGGDKNALTIRYGVILKEAKAWGQGDTRETAQEAVTQCQLHGVRELYYDAIGPGSGVKGETNRMQEENFLPENLRILPWMGSWSPIDPEGFLIPGDSQSPKNEDFFLNLKGQAWWRLRIRFEKTYRAVMHGALYPPDELISISSEIEDLEQLKRELSQATYIKNQVGKIVVDKTPEGSFSPNIADSVVMNYCPTRELSILDVL